MHERRLYERAPFRCKLTLTISGGGAPVEARCGDISLGGIGFATTYPFRAGQVVTVAFHLRAPVREIVERVAARVACVRYEHEANLVGLEFDAPLQRAHHPELVKAIERI